MDDPPAPEPVAEERGERRDDRGGQQPDQGDDPNCSRTAGSKNSALDGAEVPPPPITMCTVPFVVSTVDRSVATGTGVSVSLGCWPRIGWERS